MEVEQTNFVSHLIITVQLYYRLSKNPSVKIWSNRFQMVMVNYSKPCASLQENLMSEFYVTEQKRNFKVVFNRSCCHGNYKNVKFYLSIKIFHQYIFQLVSGNLSLAIIWQMTYTHTLRKLCSATLNELLAFSRSI